MATAQLISEAEYLNTDFRPDVDFVDGRIEERNLGDFDHADLQMGIGALLRVKQKTWGIRVLSEVRTRVGERRYRIPDLSVLRAGVQRDPVVQEPALLCIEVLSPRDTLRAMRTRVQDYLDMGVPEVWIVAPATRTVHVCAGQETLALQTGWLNVPEIDGGLSIEEIFSTLDE